MLDSDIERMMDEKAREIEPSRRHDEVHEASDSSFPASDPPAYTSAAPRKQPKYAKDKHEEEKGDASP